MDNKLAVRVGIGFLFYSLDGVASVINWFVPSVSCHFKEFDGHKKNGSETPPFRAASSAYSTIKGNITDCLLSCEIWKKPILTVFTPPRNKTISCAAPWAVFAWFTTKPYTNAPRDGTNGRKELDTTKRLPC